MGGSVQGVGVGSSTKPHALWSVTPALRRDTPAFTK